jgi:hypothetical protein
MADEKPKHKPQKKRTLEDVLKSLQDLVRNDIVSNQPERQSWRESGREDADSNAAANEPDTFNNALFKLDQIINEKIIEPVERAKETPPEPLLPDEEIEIEWDVDERIAQHSSELPAGDIAEADLAALDRAAESFESIEIQAVEPPSGESLEAPNVVATHEPLVEQEASLDVVAEPPTEPEPVEEVIAAAPLPAIEETPPEPTEIEVVAPPETLTEESIDLAPAPESVEPPDPQQMFDFNAPTPARTRAPVEPSPPVSSPSGMPTPTEISLDARASPETLPTVALEIVENLTSPPSEDLAIVDLSEDIPAVPEKSKESAEQLDVQAEAPSDTRDIPKTPTTVNLEVVENPPSPPSEDTRAVPEKPKEPPEQPDVHAVEPSSVDKAGAFTVEFTVESTAREPAKPKEPDAETATAPQTDSPAKDDNPPPPEEHVVKEQTPPPPQTEKAPDEAPKPQGTPPAPTKSTNAPDEIPVLNEVADISAPAAPPLPEVAQARDIAIRVIAKLNIERRKLGEKPLDIKTIERLQQYLADALNKRALNKLK